MKKNVRIKTFKGHNCLFSHRWLRGRGREEGFNFSVYFVQDILGDLWAISRAGRKSATKVFKHDWMSPWVPTLTETISKRLGKCWLLIGQKKCFVLSYPIEQHLLSSFRESGTGRLLFRQTCPSFLVWIGSRISKSNLFSIDLTVYLAQKEVFSTFEVESMAIYHKTKSLSRLLNKQCLATVKQNRLLWS